MKDKIIKVSTHWRDVLVVSTAILMFASFLLLTYSVSQSNKLAAQTKDLAAQTKDLSIQNQVLAQKTTDHINCIIKDLSSPRPPGAGQKIIELLGKDCNIKFTP